jgi:hypothetical protein
LHVTAVYYLGLSFLIVCLLDSQKVATTHIDEFEPEFSEISVEGLLLISHTDRPVKVLRLAAVLIIFILHIFDFASTSCFFLIVILDVSLHIADAVRGLIGSVIIVAAFIGVVVLTIVFKFHIIVAISHGGTPIETFIFTAFCSSASLNEAGCHGSVRIAAV